ncbi:unnamed protein product [Adineta steineri]|uniref:Intraflagellar transport protein 56 n=2 Tax=Adineta steineri TaxID=433720 RepID=A0A815H1M7_9BILA|nr:unnamed protein product [Adineta steineri]CAF1346255.1 unnamed protein product [Adineta steineri]
MILSRTKAADDPKKKGATQAQDKNKKKSVEVEDFIAERDYTGAIAYLEFCRQSEKEVKDLDLWLAFAAFHAGDYQRASDEYENILKKDPRNGEVCIYLACAYFMLGKYDDAEHTALKGPKSPLQTRVLFHVAHKQNNEEKLMNLHRQLQDVIEDQMCLASMHYMRSHFQEALDIYKRYLVENREYLALNVYVALCHYKLDFYDISQEILDVYCKKNPESATATNLQACNQYRLYNAKAAENDLKQFLDKMSTSFNYAKELFRHNMVVFQGGEGALQILPPLVDVIPEARLNLVIHYLKEDDLEHAYELMKDVEPLQPAEYILKGVVNAAYGQEHNSVDHIKTAQSYFQLVGGSASECDTIPGRQSMAACYFLHKRFDDVLVYLSSIKTHLEYDDLFNFNYAQAKAHEEKWKEAEEAFLLIQSEKLKNDYVYLSHEPRDTLRDILSLLRNTNHPQGDQMIKIMRSWARTNNIPV